MISRRSLITGLATVLAAPAVIRVAQMMPVKVAPAALKIRYMGLAQMKVEGGSTAFDNFDNHAFVQEMLDAIQQDEADRREWLRQRQHGIELLT